ncbi:MAG: cupin domain-containing protein [Mycobacteriales bacterium]
MTPAALDLQPHPEGGWYRETWRAPGAVATPYGERSPATAILFLLEPGQASRWHRVRSAELWLWQGGGPLALDLGGTADAPALDRTVLLGPGGVPQHLVEPGQWQAARPAGEEAVLSGCVVVPGFDFADFELQLGPDDPATPRLR